MRSHATALRACLVDQRCRRSPEQRLAAPPAAPCPGADRQGRSRFQLSAREGPTPLPVLPSGPGSSAASGHWCTDRSPEVGGSCTPASSAHWFPTYRADRRRPREQISAAAAADPAGAWRSRTRLPRGRTYRTLFVDFEAGQDIDALPGRTSASCAAWRRDHPGAESIQWALKAVHKPMLGTLRRWDACRDWPSSSCGRVACSLAWPWSTPSTFRTFRALVILGSAGRTRSGRRAVGAAEPSHPYGHTKSASPFVPDRPSPFAVVVEPGGTSWTAG